MSRITKRLIDATETRAAEYFIWDSDIPGYGLPVLPSGRKGYVGQYRAGRRSRRISLGPSTMLTCKQARNRAISFVAAARNGEDPAAERDAGRQATISTIETGSASTKLNSLLAILAALDLEFLIGPRTKSDATAIEEMFS